MKKLILISMIIVFATGLGARAEESTGHALFQPVSIRAKGGLTADAGFSTSGGSAQVTTGQMSLKAGGFSLGYEGRHYSWSDRNLLNFGNGRDNPWDTLHRVTAGYEHKGTINEDWLYSASVTGSSSFEKEISGSLGGALRGAMTYIINENWKTMFGAGVFANSIDTSIMPFLGVSYENFDRNGAGAFATLGAPGSEAGYAFSESSKIRLSLDMDTRTYRLKDESTVVQKGYMSTSGMVAGLHYDWKPTKAFSLSFGPEYHFSREMKLYNKNSDRTGGTIKQDAAFGGGVQMGYTF